MKLYESYMKKPAIFLFPYVRRFIIFFALMGGMLILAAKGLHYLNRVDNASQEGVKVLWRAPMMDGSGHMQPAPFAAYRGRILVVNFWASWCPPCVEELPALAVLSQKFSGKNITFAGIAIDSVENVTHFLKARKNSMTYPGYIAGADGTTLAFALGNRQGGVPFTVVIDATGTVRFQMLGRVDIAALRDCLNRLTVSSAQP